MNLYSNLSGWLATAMAFGLAMQPVAAGAESHQLDAEHCLSVSMIDRTDVVDDASILFYMKNDDVYLNRLPHRCPGLSFHDAFMYRTSVGQLCDLDIVTVLDSLGFGFVPGVSCGLGSFYPVADAADLEALKNAPAEGH